MSCIASLQLYYNMRFIRRPPQANVVNLRCYIMDTCSYIPKLVFLVHRLIGSSNIHLGRINATSMLRVMLKIPSVVFLPKCLFAFAVTL